METVDIETIPEPNDLRAVGFIEDAPGYYWRAGKWYFLWGGYLKHIATDLTKSEIALKHQEYLDRVNKPRG